MRAKHPTKSPGFTLIEIAIALGIISVALIGLMALLLPALEAARESSARTVTGVILEDVHNRMEGQIMESGAVVGSPYFYDDQGQFIDTDQPVEIQESKTYRAEVELLDISGSNAPDDTSGLMAAKLDLFYPIHPDTGEAFPIGTAEPEATITFYVTPLTGPDWPEIDTDYQPRIEF